MQCKKKEGAEQKYCGNAGGCALLCAGQVFAEEEEAGFQLDQVTVTADRTAGTVGQTAANVTVITAEQIKNKGARTLADALTGVSGVFVRSMGRTGENRQPILWVPTESSYLLTANA